MTNHPVRYDAFKQIVEEIARTQRAGAAVATVAMIYIGIDTMALLGCPVGKQSQTRGDFIAWVDRYLRADPRSGYQYDGLEVYAARCALLHSYGSVADLHRSRGPLRPFAYVDSGLHMAAAGEPLILISVEAFAHDFCDGLSAFLRRAVNDAELRRRVDSRVNSLLLASMLADNPPGRAAGD